MPKRLTFDSLLIETNVPLPDKRSKNDGLRRKMKTMKPLQSVYVPGTLAKRGSVVTCAKDVFGAGNYRTEKDSKGVRVWRLK